jgi:hypothetical protein
MLQNSKNYVERIDDDDDDDEEFGIPGQSSVTAKVLVSLHSSFPFATFMLLIINCCKNTVDH